MKQYKVTQADGDPRRLRTWIEHFQCISCLEDAIEEAALARGPLYKHGHQRRLKPTLLSSVAARLKKNEFKNSLEQCDTFQAVYTVVTAATIGPVFKGFGELARYDTALRIAAALSQRAGVKVLPDKVYIHHGTKDGAKKLGYDVSQPTLDPRQIPDDAIRSLKAYEIEDFLCIFKQKLGKPSSPVAPDSCCDTGRPRRKIVC